MRNLPLPGQRILILGNAGAGKSTLARQLAELLDLRHTELDALYWDPGWRPAPLAVFRERIDQVTQADRWVLDGNYGKVRDLLWARADTLVWLDYPLPVTLWRLFRRTLRRVFGGEELWNGNRERFADQFLSKDSLFLYLLKTHRRRRADLERQFAGGAYPHLVKVRLRSPRETTEWLRTLVAVE
jgi:adenylate kinase family enzyme